MLDVYHGDELCPVRRKVGMLILINETQASLHPELLVTEGQKGGACGPSNKSDKFSEMGTNLERTVLPSSFFKGLNSIIVKIQRVG